jgi:hypothetical protein
MRGKTAVATLVFLLCASPLASAPAETAGEPAADEKSDSQGNGSDSGGEGSGDWRGDPSVQRHPGSYIGGAIGYANVRSWVEESDEHDDMFVGPFHTFALSFRVGDAFFEWLALGFQIEIASAKRRGQQIGMFNLLLDTTFYPWEGLGLRPSFGLGLGFASGKEEWEFGGGGPGCLGMAVLYEVRVTRLFVIAPIVQTFWISGQGYDGLTIFAGLEILKWFETATG